MKIIGFGGASAFAIWYGNHDLPFPLHSCVICPMVQECTLAALLVLRTRFSGCWGGRACSRQRKREGSGFDAEIRCGIVIVPSELWEILGHSHWSSTAYFIGLLRGRGEPPTLFRRAWVINVINAK